MKAPSVVKAATAAATNGNNKKKKKLIVVSDDEDDEVETPKATPVKNRKLPIGVASNKNSQFNCLRVK